jgi:hypothetical protein
MMGVAAAGRGAVAAGRPQGPGGGGIRAHAEWPAARPGGLGDHVRLADALFGELRERAVEELGEALARREADHRQADCGDDAEQRDRRPAHPLQQALAGDGGPGKKAGKALSEASNHCLNIGSHAWSGKSEEVE